MNFRVIIILSFLVFGFLSPSFAIIDSVGTETIDGKIVVLHKVEPKETLYSISRKYNVTVDEITSVNPGSEMGIGLGQVLKIPTQKETTEKVEEVKSAETENKYHVVKPGETLYAISTLYPCSVDEIKVWNKLTSNALDVGQKLIVGKQEIENKTEVVVVEAEITEVEEEVIEVEEEIIENEKTEVVEEVGIEEELTSSLDKEKADAVEEELEGLKATTTDGREIDIDLNIRTKEEVEEEKKQLDNENTQKLLSEVDTDSLPSKRTVDMGGYIKEFEKGYAVLMEGTYGDQRYLAHHRTLPEGTILQIKNIDKDKSVFVRVVGVLVHDDPKVIISLSEKAETRLQSENSTFLTEISYIP